MSAIPLEDTIERESAGAESRNKLPPKALVYFLFVGAVAIAVTAPFLAQLDQTTGNWLEFAILAASVALAQFFVVRTPGNKSYHTTGVFLIAAVLLLPPALLAVLPLIQHIPEWLGAAAPGTSRPPTSSSSRSPRWRRGRLPTP